MARKKVEQPQAFAFGVNVPARPHAISFKQTVSLTKQAFRDGTRIDAVLKRYATVGVDAGRAPHLFQQSMAAAPFGVDQGRDYQAQLNAIVSVQQYFEALPSRVRARFENRPAHLVAFLADEANRKEAEELGLVEKPVEASPAVPPVAPVSPPPA